MEPLPMVKGFQKTEEFFEGWRCFNVVVGEVDHKDIDLFFGPFGDKEIVLELQPNQNSWASLLKDLEIFPSATQARKNGWDKEISIGWSEVRFKKQRTVVFVLRGPLPPIESND